VKASQATAEVFFTAFKALENTEREAFLEKVVSDPELREDLIDLALIEEARKAKGKPVSAKAYFEKRRGK
jgi:metal-sulfur cluster biosynthetic enzyme